MARMVRTADDRIRRLRPYNLVAGTLHLVQAVVFAIVLTMLGTQVTFGVTADYLAAAPGFPVPPERVELFAVNVGAGVVAFLALSALFHFLIASPLFFGRYSSGLRADHNYFRWIEYSLCQAMNHARFI